MEARRRKNLITSLSSHSSSLYDITLDKRFLRQRMTKRKSISSFPVDQRKPTNFVNNPKATAKIRVGRWLIDLLFRGFFLADETERLMDTFRNHRTRVRESVEICFVVLHCSSSSSPFFPMVVRVLISASICKQHRESSSFSAIGAGRDAAEDKRSSACMCFASLLLTRKHTHTHTQSSHCTIAERKSKWEQGKFLIRDISICYSLSLFQQIEEKGQSNETLIWQGDAKRRRRRRRRRLCLIDHRHRISFVDVQFLSFSSLRKQNARKRNEEQQQRAFIC